MNHPGKFSRSMGFKAMLIGILILIMMIPAVLVRQIVLERSMRAAEAEAEILESWGGELQVAGPVMRVPCERVEDVAVRDDKGRETRERRTVPFSLWISPAKLDAGFALKTSRKARGIFSVPVFSGLVSMEGEFAPDGAIAGLAANETAYVEGAELVLAIANQKGIRGLETATWGREALSFKPGDSGLGLLAGGISAPVSLKPGARIAFSLGVSVQGGRRVRILPLGESARVTMAADWPSPSYQGDYLPASQTQGDDGFEANWDVSYLGRGMPLSWTSYDEPADGMSRGFFGVDFFEALDRYALNDRAVKYAVLFIVVPFMALFLLELFAKREIHPIQYLLAGVANMVFYLLLLSLSEHVAFGAAYAISATSVGLLVFLYSWSLFKDLRKAWHMGPVMALSYLYLYLTLQSEDWALLIGALGAFGVTALLMFVTRDVDWYGRRRRAEAVAPYGGGEADPMDGPGGEREPFEP